MINRQIWMIRLIIALIILVVMVLTAYQTLELTRYIVVNGWLGWPEMRDVFIAELALIWGFYMSIPFILNYMIWCAIKIAVKQFTSQALKE